jgi:hypothetical protein
MAQTTREASFGPAAATVVLLLLRGISCCCYVAAVVGPFRVVGLVPSLHVT